MDRARVCIYLIHIYIYVHAPQKQENQKKSNNEYVLYI